MIRIFGGSTVSTCAGCYDICFVGYNVVLCACHFLRLWKTDKNYQTASTCSNNNAANNKAWNFRLLCVFYFFGILRFEGKHVSSNVSFIRDLLFNPSLEHP